VWLQGKVIGFFLIRREHQPLDLKRCLAVQYCHLLHFSLQAGATSSAYKPPGNRGFSLMGYVLSLSICAAAIWLIWVFLARGSCYLQSLSYFDIFSA
jgi:hypothetical protein